MVVVETYNHSQQQSLVLVLVEAEGPLLQEASVLAVAGYMVTMFAQLRIPFALVVRREDILRRCVTHPGGQSQSHSSSQQNKVVTEVQTHDDQNNGNKTKNVDIVEMIRSMGLRAKNPSQVASVQEMSIVHEDTKPVFYSPVQPEIVTTIWDQVCGVMDPEVCVATPIEHCVYETKHINVIMVHDMELKSAHHSNVTINGRMVQVKQDTGAEINVMSKCVFDKLNISSSTTRNSVMLNRSKTVKITGYGENLIEYIRACVFKVSHNNQHKDVLFFITNVNDDKVILGAKSCQEFNLVKIVCGDKCSCKTSEIMSINQ